MGMKESSFCGQKFIDKGIISQRILVLGVPRERLGVSFSEDVDAPKLKYFGK